MNGHRYAALGRGARGSARWLSLGAITSDPLTVATPAGQAWIARAVAEGVNLSKLGIPTVTLAPGGRVHCVDGHRRLELLRRTGFTHRVYCRIQPAVVPGDATGTARGRPHRPGRPEPPQP